MSKINDGGPAFPYIETGDCGVRPGMTLRDYFAAKAMAAMYQNSNWHHSTRDEIAHDAYAQADAMLAARGQEKTNQCGETCERAKLCAVCAAPLEQATPATDGWIEWNGGNCPVPGDTVVQIKLRGGGVENSGLAWRYGWDKDNNAAGDIVAYRVVQEGGAA